MRPVILFNLVNICNLKRNLIGSGGLVKIGLVKMGRERYLTGEGLKVVLAEFTTLS